MATAERTLDELTETSTLGTRRRKSSGQSSSDVDIYLQNQLPKNVDYAAKANGPVTVVGRSGDIGNRLHEPAGCSYHVARREVYVADSGNYRVMMYDCDGNNGLKFAKLWYPPRDVAVSTDGKFVYIAIDEALIKTNVMGEHVKSITNFSLGEFKTCNSVVCHGQFTLVVDRDNKCVVVFNRVDEEIRCFGKEQLSWPLHVAVAGDQKVYVTDQVGGCIRVFSWKGKYLRSFGDTEEMNYRTRYSGITADADGIVCVSRAGSDQIEVYDASGKFVTTIGSFGEESGQLNEPWGLNLCPDGRLMVADEYNDRVQIFQ